MNSKFILPAAIMILLAGSCKKDDNPKNPFNENFENGVLIMNQGVFQSGNGDISFYNRETKKVSNALFQTINNRPAGDVVQSVARYNGKYYIVANGSGKIEIAEEGSFKEAGVIKDLLQPRYFLGISSTKAYVSEWGSDGLTGTVAVIDLASKSVTKRINVGKGAENMIISGNKVLVASFGGYGVDSTVFVIDFTSDSVIDTIMVEHNPNSFALDANNKIWVLCGGKMSGMGMETQPALVRINPTDYTIESTIAMSGSYSMGTNLCINNEKNKMYFGLYYGSGVYSMGIDGSAISSVINRKAAGLGIDPKNNNIYCADPVDYIETGTVYIYSPSYQFVDSIKVGMVPGGFLFN